MNLFKAMATVGGLTGLSRIAGFTRDIMTAAILGAGGIGDAFFVALKLPNLFRRITAEGAFSVSFVPIYSSMLEKRGREESDAFASNVFMVMSLWLSIFVILAIAAMPWIIYAIAPGFSDDPARYDLAVEFSRITFPYLLFMSLTAMLGGVLNALDRFGPFAFAPVLFNLCLIGALLMSDMAQTAGHAMSYGIFVAGMLQLMYLLLSARKSGFVPRFARPRVDADVKKVLKLMGPGVVGAGVMHLNLFADLIIASFLQTGSISYLYYADRLNQLPLGVVGIAVGTALLPMLSRAVAKGDVAKAKNLFNRAMEFCFLLALPAAVALMIIPNILIKVLFERGAFDASDTATTALVLLCYAIGLPAYITVKVFATAHWSRQDTTTPVKISIIATITNIISSLILTRFIGVAGIALGTGLTGWLQYALYMRALRGQEATQFDTRFKKALPRIVLSTACMGAFLFVAGEFAHDFLNDGLFIKIVVLGVLVSLSMIIYATAILASGALTKNDLKKYLKK